MKVERLTGFNVLKKKEDQVDRAAMMLNVACVVAAFSLETAYEAHLIYLLTIGNCPQTAAIISGLRVTSTQAASTGAYRLWTKLLRFLDYRFSRVSLLWLVDAGLM